MILAKGLCFMMKKIILRNYLRPEAVGITGILLAVLLVNLNCSKDSVVTDPGVEAEFSLHYDGEPCSGACRNPWRSRSG